MPGLAGLIVSQPGVAAAPTLESMVKSMQNEPFYSSGTITESSLGAFAGWVCHAGSYADTPPIWNDDRTIALVFAGEHFADPDTTRLKSGRTFSVDDASSLVHLYEEHGPAFVERLNGTFSGVVLDRRENRVVLFNDRFGLGRVYVHENADGLYFASEAKALLRVLPNLRVLDLQGLAEQVVCGCTMQDRTLFTGISLLPPGSRWILSPGRPVRKETYFNRTEWEAQAPLAPEAYYESLKGTFNRILPRYFRGKQKVALSLTGGLDSRMIIAGVNAGPGELPCYTFAGMYRECEDARLARSIAAMCRQPHGVIKVDQKFFPGFLERATRCVYLSDGTMDVSGSVGLYVNRQGRDFGLVRMTGNYGSEILRGNVAFKASKVTGSAFGAEMLPRFSQAMETYRQERQACSRLSFIAFKQVPWHHYSRLSEEQSQLVVRAPYLDNELVALAYQAPGGLLLNKQLAYRYTTDVQPALAGAPTDRGLLDRPGLVPTKVFELSKEIRPKLEYYYDYGMPDWFAKVDRVLSPLHLERIFLGQQKYYHFRTWYRHELADDVKAVLLDPRTLNRSYLNRREVEALVNAHTRGTGNHTLEIHRLMTGELIERELLGH